MRPRVEIWDNVASHLRRFIRPRLGKKITSEVAKTSRRCPTTSSRASSTASRRCAMAAIGTPAEAAPRLVGRTMGARSTELQITEQTIHPPGPVGAVGLFREAVGLQDIADLPARADDLEGDTARGELAMEIVEHFGTRQIDE